MIAIELLFDIIFCLIHIFLVDILFVVHFVQFYLNSQLYFTIKRIIIIKNFSLKVFNLRFIDFKKSADSKKALHDYQV